MGMNIEEAKREVDKILSRIREMIMKESKLAWLTIEKGKVTTKAFTFKEDSTASKDEKADSFISFTRSIVYEILETLSKEKELTLEDVNIVVAEVIYCTYDALLYDIESKKLSYIA